MFVALFAVTLLVGGCGGGGSATTKGDATTVEAGSLTKAEFVKKANAICEEQRAQFDRSYGELLENAQPANSSPKELESLLSGVVDSIVIPVYEEEIEEISALGAPAEYTAQVSKFLQALRSRLAVIHSDPGEFSRTSTPFKKAEDLASKYGMAGCAESLS